MQKDASTKICDMSTTGALLHGTQNKGNTHLVCIFNCCFVSPSSVSVCPSWDTFWFNSCFSSITCCQHSSLTCCFTRTMVISTENNNYFLLFFVQRKPTDKIQYIYFKTNMKHDQSKWSLGQTKSRLHTNLNVQDQRYLKQSLIS